MEAKAVGSEGRRSERTTTDCGVINNRLWCHQKLTIDVQCSH